MPLAAPLLRPVGAEATALLAALHGAAFPSAEAWSADAIALMLGLAGAMALVAVEAGKPVGFGLARVVADEAELLTLAVLPGARRRGCARALLAGLAARCAVRGATALFIDVSEANMPARALYDAVGACVVGRRQRYYRDGTDALVLRLELAEAR